MSRKTASAKKVFHGYATYGEFIELVLSDEDVYFVRFSTRMDSGKWTQESIEDFTASDDGFEWGFSKMRFVDLDQKGLNKYRLPKIS